MMGKSKTLFSVRTLIGCIMSCMIVCMHLPVIFFKLSENQNSILLRTLSKHYVKGWCNEFADVILEEVGPSAAAESVAAKKCFQCGRAAVTACPASG